MIIERPTHEVIIAVPDCNYLAAIEALYGSEDDDTCRRIRFGVVGSSDSVDLYPDQIAGFRHLLDEVEKYFKAKEVT